MLLIVNASERSHTFGVKSMDDLASTLALVRSMVPREDIVRITLESNDLRERHACWYNADFTSWANNTFLQQAFVDAGFHIPPLVSDSEPQTN